MHGVWMFWDSEGKSHPCLSPLPVHVGVSKTTSIVSPVYCHLSLSTSLVSPVYCHLSLSTSACQRRRRLSALSTVTSLCPRRRVSDDVDCKPCLLSPLPVHVGVSKTTSIVSTVYCHLSLSTSARQRRRRERETLRISQLVTSEQRALSSRNYGTVVHSQKKVPAIGEDHVTDRRMKRMVESPALLTRGIQFESGFNVSWLLNKTKDPRIQYIDTESWRYVGWARVCLSHATQPVRSCCAERTSSPVSQDLNLAARRPVPARGARGLVNPSFVTTETGHYVTASGRCVEKQYLFKECMSVYRVETSCCDVKRIRWHARRRNEYVYGTKLRYTRQHYFEEMCLYMASMVRGLIQSIFYIRIYTICSSVFVRLFLSLLPENLSSVQVIEPESPKERGKPVYRNSGSKTIWGCPIVNPKYSAVSHEATIAGHQYLSLLLISVNGSIQTEQLWMLVGCQSSLLVTDDDRCPAGRLSPDQQCMLLHWSIQTRQLSLVYIVIAANPNVAVPLLFFPEALQKSKDLLLQGESEEEKLPNGSARKGKEYIYVQQLIFSVTAHYKNIIKY
ncbi:hypothetical protein PR048_010830 [Dryococelus australis]|uniref:Uncharacterized protein n=1 Tax=Dryococelus australis TaxID=614101 RepID=A0ABQ9I3T9_9NEOP|nr:hypothetical protein PR048_010830 [Dryococelus australis]